MQSPFLLWRSGSVIDIERFCNCRRNRCRRRYQDRYDACERTYRQLYQQYPTSYPWMLNKISSPSLELTNRGIGRNYGSTAGAKTGVFYSLNLYIFLWRLVVGIGSVKIWKVITDLSEDKCQANWNAKKIKLQIQNIYSSAMLYWAMFFFKWHQMPVQNPTHQYQYGR